MGGHRGEDVAAVKGVGNRMQVEALFRKHNRFRYTPQGLRRQNEQSVVRADQQCAALRLQGKLPSVRADTRIYHRQVYRVLWHVAGGMLQDLSPSLNPEAGYLMRQVNYGHARCDPQHHSLARTGEIVGQTKV